jgi:hypothetical protein
MRESESERRFPVKPILAIETVLLVIALIIPLMPSRSGGGPLVNLPEGWPGYLAAVGIVWLAGNGLLIVLTAVALVNRFIRERFRD